MASGHEGQRSGGVRPGVPGAGWVLGIFVVFAVIVLTGMAEGWWDNNRTVATAPAASHHTTTGAANTRTQ